MITKTTTKLMAITALIALSSYQIGISQTNPTAQSLPYSKNFGTTTFTVAPTGMAVWTINSSPASSQSDAESSTANGNATITAATATQTTGDAYGYATSSNGRLYFQTSSNATNGTNQPVLAIVTTGLQNISVGYSIEMISVTARTIGFVLQYRIATSGSWTDVSGGVYSHNSSDRSNGQVDTYTVTLPTAAENQSVVQLRWAVWRGTQSGNSSGAALDNISVSGTTQVGGYFRSKQNGNWNVLSTWEASADSATWVNAAVIPSYHANSILVKDSVSITASDSIDQVTVSTSGILTYANITGSTVYIMNGTGVDLNVLGKYYDAGANSTVWATSSTWQLGSTASLIRNRNTSSNNWQNHYNNINNIPATSNWYIIKNSSDDPSLSSTSNVHYGNLYILNTTGTLWTTPSSSSFTGSSDFPTIKGNLYIGSNVSFLNNNTNASPAKVVGNTTLVSGSTIRNQGTGFELQGDVTINGTISTTGSAYILLSGDTTQTMSGSGLSFQYLTIHKSSFPASVTLSSPATITGTLTLTNGLIVTDTVNLLTFNAGSAVNGVNNDTSFVSGPIKKIGNTAFTFPLGKNTNAQIISITAPTSSTDAFQAEYFDTNPTTIYGVYTDTTFNYISTCQYFKLLRKNGTSNIQPTLSYDLSSCVSNLLPAPRVIGYNGTKWKDLGESNLTFSASGGSISTASVVTQYGAMTLGNYNPLISNTPTGDTCFAAIIMPAAATSTLSGQSQTKEVKWFTFTPQTPEIKITLTNTSMGSNHIHAIALMEGVCLASIVAGRDTSTTDTTLTILMHELIVGTPYFITTFATCTTCTSTPATFNLKVENLTPPTQTYSNNVVYFNGTPSHMKQQIIIRVDKSHLNMSNVDNTSMLSGTTSQFLDTTTINNIANLAYNGNVSLVNGLGLTKVFPSLTSADSLSISRDSVMVRTPNFYEIFVLTVTEKDKIFYESRLLSTILKYAEPNMVAQLSSIPNDNDYPNQANLHPTTTFPNGNIDVEGAWDIETGKSFVKIGVYDGGIDQTNDDLNNGKVARGFDYTVPGGAVLTAGANNDGTSDGHGTSCAGIIGAFRNNKTGIGTGKIAGIAGGDALASPPNPGCTLYDMKVIANPSTSMTNVANAIMDGARSSAAGGLGLHIMNCSWGVQGINAQSDLNTLLLAVQYATLNGVVFVTSRGNYPDEVPLDDMQYPACFQDELVICVGASGTDGAWKTTTNGNTSDMTDMNFQSLTGHGVDIVAPGTNALVQTTSAGNNSTHSFSGTSGSCPHVAGVAALMLSQMDQATPATNNLVIEDVEQILQMTALDKNTIGYDNFSGWGLLNATETMLSAQAPAFKVQHFAVGQNVTSSNVSITNIVTTSVTLPDAYGSLPAGIYLGDWKQITITLNYHLSSPNDQIITSWPRISCTSGWQQVNPINTNNWCTIISASATKAVLQTYLFDFKETQNGSTIDPLYPTQNPVAGLSIYTFDPTLAGIAQLNNNSSLMAVYPNPANNQSMVNISLSHSQQVSLELYDTKGSLIKTILKEKLPEGRNQYQVSLADVAQGAYFYRLVSEDGVCEKKLIVIK